MREDFEHGAQRLLNMAHKTLNIRHKTLKHNTLNITYTRL